jgi:RNA polymerase sigma-54 factor
VKPTLQLKLSQHLALTPQLQQSIRLLQLSSLELQQEINQMIADNPLLEVTEPILEGDEEFAQQVKKTTGDDVEFGEVKTSDDAPSDLEGAPSTDAAQEAVEFEMDERAGAEEWPGSPETGDDDEQTFQQATSVSLRDHLLDQVSLVRADEDVITLLKMLIEAVDEKGMLSISRDEINFMLAEASGNIAPQVSADLWEAAVAQLQTFDPTGVGARTLPECIALQLRAMPETVAQVDALSIVNDHFDSLLAKDTQRIKRALQMEDDDYRAALALIQKTTPKPGAPFADDTATFVTPDVIVRKSRRRWVAGLNPSTMPKLRVNSIYAGILAANKAGRTTPMSAQLQEARWLIRNVEQRFATIQRVATAIVERQQAFFDHGDIAMRPLTLREIADELSLHESTISRVTSSKYMSSPRGVFELKYFFGSGVATDVGGSASSTAIKAMLKQMIAAEDCKKPLTDSTLAELLEAQGVLVARRTVAKYREMLGIHPVSERRQHPPSASQT